MNAKIASDMKGNFILGSNKITITGLHYTVPGAHIAMKSASIRSTAKCLTSTERRGLHAKVSQMVTGWKSLLLKPVDPFFSKNGAGTEVPIQITGTRSDPHFGLDFHRKDDKTAIRPQRATAPLRGAALLQCAGL